jgi:hypothetical protein
MKEVQMTNFLRSFTKHYLVGGNKAVQCSLVGIPGQLSIVQNVKKRKQIK